MKGSLFIISSPSGGGKGTLIRRALAELDNLRYSVSYTTRKMREGEADGVEYHFVSVGEFEELMADGDLLEYALVHGNYYGTSKSQIETATAEGFDVILEIDVQGAKIVRRKREEAINIFILPPSFEVLAERLKNRRTETEDQLAIRLENARQEVMFYSSCDYIIVNDDLETAVTDLKSIVRAERVRRNRQMDTLRDILTTFES
ncbi:MAG: guanylate kinase [Acidobacteria bacterium]|nr:MAG: guanylate kinase [Acidobacteriota bacterium]REK01575.1 MAG: guanylate kinase [Acidobacteriota bacterium]REK14531.1 MAG: guanylate kinase [Acidobacteriota bacterium]REK45246.1 MAG: guanylate kinase [Acidobacteriota bacterium]